MQMVHGFLPFHDRDFKRLCLKILRKPVRFHPIGYTNKINRPLPSTRTMPHKLPLRFLKINQHVHARGTYTCTAPPTTSSRR